MHFVYWVGFVTLVLLCFSPINYALISNNDTIYTPEVCEFFADPRSRDGNLVVADISSNFVLTNFGRINQPTLFFLEGDMTFDNTTFDMYIDKRPLCFTVQSPAFTGNETIHVHNIFGKTYATHGQFAAVGITNANEQKALGKYSYSSISIIEYMPNRKALFREYIEDFSSPLFGTIFDINSHSLASIVNNREIKVFSPYVNRTKSFWNSDLGDRDSVLHLPPDFFPESLSLSENFLLVSGIAFNPVYGLCTPAILAYRHSKTTDRYYFLYQDRIMRGENPISPMNYYPCDKVPTNRILVSISPDEKYVLISVKQWNTVFLSEVRTFSSRLSQLTPKNVPSWGKAIGFTRNNTIFVLSDNNIFLMSIEDFLMNSVRSPAWEILPVNPFDIALAFPNRIQKRTDGNAEVFFEDAAANNNAVIGVTKMNPAYPKLNFYPIPAPAPGFEYDYSNGDWKACEPGRFKDTADDFYPCKFCDAGTYQPNTGSSTECLPCADVNATYCPAGSSIPLTIEDLKRIFEETNTDVEDADVIRETAPDTRVGRLPEFESEDFRETYEELLIVNLFSIYSTPMIIALVWTGIVWFSVAVASLFYCHIPTRNFMISVINIIKYVRIPNLHDYEHHDGNVSHGHNHHNDAHNNSHNEDHSHSEESKISLASIRNKIKSQIFGIKTKEDHANSHDSSHSSKDLEEKQIQYGDYNITVTEPVATSSASADSKQYMDQVQEKILQGIIEEEDRVIVTRKKVDFHGILTGYFNSIFLLFSISAIIISIIFVFSYTPELPGSNTKKDKNRFNSESLTLRDSEDSESLEAQASRALLRTAFTIQADLIGYSGVSCSWQDDVIGFHFDGCWVEDSYSVTPCNESLVVTSSLRAYAHPKLQRTCVYEVTMPKNTVLSNYETRFMLLFKPNLHIQALRYTFYQAPIGPSKEDSLFEIGEYQFREVILNVADGNNYMAPVFSRTWIWTPVVYKYQFKDQNVNAFKAKAYTTMTCEDEPVFPSTSYIAYLNDQTTTTKFIINLNLNSVILVRKSEKLIQNKAALLIILLAIIGVYHLLHFMELIAELIISVVGILFSLIRRPIKKKIRKIKAEKEAVKRSVRMSRKLHERMSKHFETETLKKQLLLEELDEL